MHITVNQELLAYIDPLTVDEHDALERSLLAEGCRDALVLWGDVLVDGHNRYGICRKHGIPFNTVQHILFQSMDDVHVWMIEQHLGRRSLTDFQRGMLALRKKGILAERARAADNEASAHTASTSGPVVPEPKISRKGIAKEARISSNTVSQIEKIQKSAAPQLVAAVKAGTISINAAATIASLPVVEQVAAVAGGAKELRQVARQVREAKAVERAEPETPEAVIARLTQTISRLKCENAALKEQLAALNS
jgi:hypothetical protein